MASADRGRPGRAGWDRERGARAGAWLCAGIDDDELTTGLQGREDGVVHLVAIDLHVRDVVVDDVHEHPVEVLGLGRQVDLRGPGIEVGNESGDGDLLDDPVRGLR